LTPGFFLMPLSWLSGVCQRVALARPQHLNLNWYLDEPFSSVETGLQIELAGT
jgi:ABC-type thiamine transport system ATPase subunit